mmetsp:Transcript_20320/g.44484  ORF Transcript_20320/g.44484 Transcript_20320/m.44484 type:complete len:207 (+) Transcript_20320:767-1387(+)
MRAVLAGTIWCWKAHAMALWRWGARFVRKGLAMTMGRSSDISASVRWASGLERRRRHLRPETGGWVFARPSRMTLVVMQSAVTASRVSVVVLCSSPSRTPSPMMSLAYSTERQSPCVSCSWGSESTSEIWDIRIRALMCSDDIRRPFMVLCLLTGLRGLPSDSLSDDSPEEEEDSSAKACWRFRGSIMCTEAEPLRIMYNRFNVVP